MVDGLDEARDAFAQEIPHAERQRDQAGRFVSTRAPEPIFQPRPVEGDPLTGDTSDAGPDPRFLEQERRIADGRSEERDVPAAAARARQAANDNRHDTTDDEPPQRIGEEADATGQDLEKSDQGAGSEQEVAEQDDSPRYKIQVDGEEKEVSLNEALRGYTREATFNERMAKMVEVAKQIDQRGAEAQQARQAYIQLCRNQEEEFAALIPREPDWEALYRTDPAGAHNLEKNYRHIYGTLAQIRQRRAMVEQEAANENARRTADYARAEFQKFCTRNKLTTQAEVEKALFHMRRTLRSHNFSEDEIGSTYDERMLSVAHKAAKYDNMMDTRPKPVQPEAQGALRPGSAPRVGNGAARGMNEAQKRLAASGRVDDAALVMAQLIGR